MQNDHQNKMMDSKNYKDKLLRCTEPLCRNEFVYTVGEQMYFKERGLENQPKRCHNCRNKRKKLGLNQSNQNERE